MLAVWDGNAIKLDCDDNCTTTNVINSLSKKKKKKRQQSSRQGSNGKHKQQFSASVIWSPVQLVGIDTV